MGEAAEDAERRADAEVEDGGAVLAVRETSPPATLFRTDDPVEIIERATAVAQALSDVLKKQGLTTRIGNKDHVRVEGWTLCGSMLGVFPVVVWTRQLENGWEARVEARTRDGGVVGAAESECLSTENRWKTADDYSVRSMAQTRAISKALRAPLGFVVALAGFDPTPEEEMHGVIDRPPKPFDPETDLMEGAIKGADAPKRLTQALNGLDPTVDWQAVIHDACLLKWGAGWRDLSEPSQKEFWRRLSNAVEWMAGVCPPGSMPPISAEQIIAGFAFAFSGVAIEAVTYQEPADAPLAGVEIPEPADDIPFTPPEEKP